MKEHAHFGRTPNLRPRSAGVALATPRSVGPDQLASEAARSGSAAALSERLQLPRPGSATGAARSVVPPVDRSSKTRVGESEGAGLNPTVLLSKPPMRPRSAILGSRGVVSQHRMDILQTAMVNRTNQVQIEAAPAGPEPQSNTLASQLQRIVSKVDTSDQERQATCRSRPALKRPFSATPSTAANELTGQRGRLLTSKQYAQDSGHDHSTASRGKRPFSAAPQLCGATLRTGDQRVSVGPARNHHIHCENQEEPRNVLPSSTAVALISSHHRDTFVYAVPRHCLEHGRPYNPYDILTVSHEVLFGSNPSSRDLRPSMHDYYTVSSSGMTFHSKTDNFEPSFLTASEWERQKACFQLLCELPTFQTFRYRKVFIAWRYWIRSAKVEAARLAMMSSLYFTQPILHEGMKAVQDELARLQSINLMCDLGGTTHHLSQFAAKSNEYTQNQGREIVKVTCRIQDVLLRVCQESLNSTENPYGGFPGHEFALSTRKSSNYHIFEAFVERERALATANHQLVQHQHFQMNGGQMQPSNVALSMAAQLRTTHRRYLERILRAQQQRPQDTLDEIRWTLAAIQRRRCLLLSKFVSLVDFMVLDALHSLLVRSVQLLRDSLLVGANALPLSQLVEPQDFILAFHRSIDRFSDSRDQVSGGTTGKSREQLHPLSFNKNQTKRFLRAAWEAKLPKLVRRIADEPAELSLREQTVTSTVWLESRLDSFFTQALRARCGEAEFYSQDDFMFVVERTLADAFVLPDFDPSRCFITIARSHDDGNNSIEEGSLESTAKQIQQFDTLSPVTLLHVSLMLQVNEPSKACSIIFKPSLDRVPSLIEEVLANFIELFQGIPSVALHQELRAVLEFADDFRSCSIAKEKDGVTLTSTMPQVSSDSEEESRWKRSNYERLVTRVGNDPHCLMLRVNINRLIRSAIAGAEALSRLYDDILTTYTGNETIDFETYRARFRMGQYSIRDMEEDIGRFKSTHRDVQNLKESQTVEFLLCDISHLKNSLSPSPARCLQELCSLFPQLALEKCETFRVSIRNASVRIEKPSLKDDLRAFSHYLLNLREVHDEVDELESSLAFLHELFQMFERLGIQVPDSVSQVFDLCDPEFAAFRTHLDDALSKRDSDIHERSPILLEHVKQLNNDIEFLKSSSTDQAMNSADSASHHARELANALEKKAEALSSQSAQLVWVQRVFCEFTNGWRPPLEDFSELQVVSSELKLKNELWEAVNDSEGYLNAKRDETLRLIDLAQMKSLLTKIDAVTKRLQQQSVHVSAIKRLDSCKAVLEGLTPVIRDLRNENLEERHWIKLEHKIDCSFVCYQPHVLEETEEASSTDPVVIEMKYLDLPLRHLLNIEAVKHAALIHQISEEATAEAAIAKSFQSVEKTWGTREIPCFQKKDRDGRDAICLGDCSEVVALLEESEVLLRVMESSSYARIIHPKMMKLLQDLSHTKETVELLIVCQQKREQLQQLLSVDFSRSYPEESKAFLVHDTNWKAIMEGIMKRPLCLAFGTNTENRQTLQSTFQGFENAAVFLKQHLQMKRGVFPAFYKLSNTELATLLSRVRDVNNIQQYLYQCFDNVARINFGTREACQDVLSISSRSFPHIETISMGKNLKARGPPEQWLLAVEKRLIETLRKSTKESLLMMSQASVMGGNAIDTASLQAIPLQCIILADRILQCELLDSLLVNKEGSTSQETVSPSSQSATHSRLKDLRDVTMERVFGVKEDSQLTDMTPRDLLLLSCLRLLEIEFRDVVDEHFLSVSSGGSAYRSNAYGEGNHWEMQLKHRFDDSTTVGYDCHVEIAGSRVPYGFNYTNDNAELVFTPRSMRFVFSVYAATRNNQVTLLSGPSGSGKQSLALQISRLFGRRLFGTDVSESNKSSYLQLAHCLKLICGAIQAGGVLFIGVRPQAEILGLFRLICPVLLKVQLSALCKIPITDLQNHPLPWVPGTTLIFSSDHPTLACPRWLQTNHELDLLARTFACISVSMDHEMVIVLEALLYSRHLEAPKRTAQKLNLLWSQLKSLEPLFPETLVQSASNVFSLQLAKEVIAKVAEGARKNLEAFQREELQCYLICEAFMELCSPLFSSTGADVPIIVRDALDRCFKYQNHAREWYTKQWRRRNASNQALESEKLEELLFEAAHESHYIPRRRLITKSIEVMKGLCSSVGVIAVGPSGVGKGAMREVLSVTMSKWKNELLAESVTRSEPHPEAHLAASGRVDNIPHAHSFTPTRPPDPANAPFVTVRVVFPASLTLAQLYGSSSTDQKGHVKSLLGRFIRDAQELYGLGTDHEIRHILNSSHGSATFGSLLAMQKLLWIVFDGGATCCGSWLDIVLSVLTKKSVFGRMDNCETPFRELMRFHDGDFMTIPPNLRFIFDTWNLENATPAILQHCAVVVFAEEEEIDKDDEDAVPIHFACIHRFLQQQRLEGSFSADGEPFIAHLAKMSALVYDTIANKLLESDILGQLFAMMDDYGVIFSISILHRVEYMLSLLQAMLNRVAASCTASRNNDSCPLVMIPEDEIRHRVEMAIVYALLWGFCTCCVSGGDDSRSRALQLLISGKIKRIFDSLSYIWEDCGRDANLFEVLADINGLRFVSLDSSDAVILREKLWRHQLGTLSSGVSNWDQHSHSLFVPTQSSLVVHAAMKESIRSARGVLLVGSDTSRKTTLLQNFLRQVESIKVLTTSNYASIPVPPPTLSAGVTTDGTPKRKRGVALLRVPLFAETDNPYASLDRIRLHQVGLVKRLAKRFRKVNKAAAEAAARNAAERYGQSRINGNGGQNAGTDRSNSSKADSQWFLQPSLQPNKSGMVSKFDVGDFIPFFFAMNQADRGIDGLAKCLERMLQRERTGIFEPPPGKVAVLLIDDLHLPVMDQDEVFPSCHEYLRSVHELGSVLSRPINALGATSITIENLMMVASISSLAMPTLTSKSLGRSSLTTKHDSLAKLIKQFVPVYAPACSLSDLYTIFHTLVVAQWERNSSYSVEKVSTILRQHLAVIVSATTVLWERLRRRATALDDVYAGMSFDLHTLSRLYSGICSIEPAFLLDSDTLTRLWSHEALKSFGSAPVPHWMPLVQADIYRVRVLLDGIDPSQHGHNKKTAANSLSTTTVSESSKLTPAVGSTSVASHDERETTRATNLNTSTNMNGLLAFFSGELLDLTDKKLSDFDLILSPQQRAAYERKKLHVISTWAFVLSSLYYQRSSGGEVSGDGRDGPRQLQRRNSIKLIRRKTLENVIEGSISGGISSRTTSRAASLGNSRWIYAEIPLLVDGTPVYDDSFTQSFDSMFAAIHVFEPHSTGEMDVNQVTDLSLQMNLAQLPQGAPSVTPLVATNIATLERVFAPQGSRCVLLASPGSGRDILIRYACAVRQTSQPQSIWTMEGVPDANRLEKKWKHVVSQLFQRIGVELECATLVVKRLQHWPRSLISQLLALMIAGEIPGAFNLDEQIHLACRVRDERLIDLEQRYQSNVARVRQEVEMEKEHEILAMGEDASLPKSRASSSYHELEKKYQHILFIRLTQVQLRYQQDQDDFTRKCEVENESVTATIMSLMRPLGMTSGKWQQIIQRMRKHLRVVIMVDSDECEAVASMMPQVLRSCSLARMSPLDINSLKTLLYSTFRKEVQTRLRSRIQRESEIDLEDLESRADMTQFLDRVEHQLSNIVAFAAEMHTSAKGLAADGSRKLSTEYAISMARFFGRFLWSYYSEERERRRKVEWFMYVYRSMEKALWKLQDRDGELKGQLESCDRQIEVSQDLLLEQKEDCDRIRDMMKRYQESAEDQVQVTNEMELRAQAELHVPMACLEEANAALLLIDKRHIIEIKSFNSPPLLVHLVLDAICVMFQLEPAWDNARKILSDSNVVHTLLTFDKDNISDDIVEKLETTYIHDPRFHREEVEKQSVAASMMVVWVRAMYQYATARRQVMPTLQKLEQAQSRLRLLMQEYQVSKQRVVEADEAFAKTKVTLEEAHSLRRQTVDEMESRKNRLDSGRIVLDVLGDEKCEAEIESCWLDQKRRLGLTWWNALLAAANLAYGAHFDTSDRLRLFEKWRSIYLREFAPSLSEDDIDCNIEFCFIPTVSIKIKEQSLKDQSDSAKKLTTLPSTILNNPNTLFSQRENVWRIPSCCGCLFSEKNLHDAALLSQTTAAGFPVVMITSYTIEMEDLLVTCARNVWKWTQFFMVRANATDLQETILTAVQEGHQLLILDVDPLDCEYKLGKLWELFHWHRSTTTSTENENASEYLILKRDESSSSTEGSDNQNNNPNIVPVHKSFRAVMISYHETSAFGDSLMSRVPVISARTYSSEITGIILDKLWHPGLFEGGQHGFGLKQSVRDFERLHFQYEDAKADLTKLIQGAAVRGQFELQETDLIRAACAKSQEVRAGLQQKRIEIQERILAVEKQSMIARLGAAIFNGVNSTAESVVTGSTARELLSIRLFVSMFLVAVRRPQVTMSTSQHPSPTHMASSAAQGSIARSSSKLGVVGLHQQPSSSMAAGTVPSKAGGFDSIGEIVKRMLQQIMPLVQDTVDWFKFVAHFTWYLERQYPADQTICHSPVTEAITKSFQDTEYLRLRRLLALLKLSHWKSDGECGDYEVLLQNQQDFETITSLVVSGHSEVPGTSYRESSTLTSSPDLSPVFAASRCRAERVKSALSVYPHLAESLCDKILQLYGVQVQFLRDEFRESDADTQLGWLDIVHGFPNTTSIAVKSSSPFGGFNFLVLAFFKSTSSHDNRLEVLKAALARPFASSKQLDTVFMLPNARLHSEILGGDRRQASSPLTECALMVNKFTGLLQIDQDKLESFLEDVPLTIINFQLGADSATMSELWEELHHLVNASPEKTMSTELRRYETSGKPIQRVANSSAEHAKGVPSSGTVSLSLQSRGPTARRFSTHGLQHRRSDTTALLKATTAPPSFIAVTQDTSAIPPHIRANTVVINAEPTEVGGGGSPSFKRCIQEVLVAVAFHPCADTIRQVLAGQESDPTVKTSRGMLCETAQDVCWLGVQLWHHLTVLVVFHSTLTYRRQLSLCQYASISSVEVPSEQYSWDVFISALNQLLSLFVQARAPNKATPLPSPQERSEQLFMRVQSLVYMANYPRQARTQQELAVLRKLCGEYICLVRESTLTQTNATHSTFSMPYAPGISSSRSGRSHRILNVAGSSLSLSTMATPPSHTASSRTIMNRQSSGGTASLLAGMNLPFEILRNSVRDAESWLETLWSYSEKIDGTVETVSRDLFGLFVPVEGDHAPHPDSSHTSPVWVELFGWVRRPIRYGSVASQIILDDALRCLRLVNEYILPPEFSHGDPSSKAATAESSAHCDEESGGVQCSDDEAEETGDPPGDAEREASVEQTQLTLGEVTATNRELNVEDPTDATDSIAASLQSQCLASFVSCYNSHVNAVRTAVSKLIDALLHWKSLCVSEEQATLAAVADVETQNDVLAVLCNRVPARLRERVAMLSPTHLLATLDVSLDVLLAHHRRWRKNLEQQQQRAPQPWIEWWLPGVPSCASLYYLLELASQQQHGAAPLSEGSTLRDVVFSLRVESSDEAHRSDDETRVPEGTFAVLSGLELRLALWDAERGYLQPLDRQSPRAPQRVSVLCQRAPERDARRAERSCALLTRGGVALELPLPVGPAVGALVAPYLAFAAP